jgi:hypothetical protein
MPEETQQDLGVDFDGYFDPPVALVLQQDGLDRKINLYAVSVRKK